MIQSKVIHRMALAGVLLGAMALPVSAQSAVPIQHAPTADVEVLDRLKEALASKFRLEASAEGMRLMDGRPLARALASCNAAVPGDRRGAADCLRVGTAVAKSGEGSGESLFARSCGLGSALGCQFWSDGLAASGFPDLAARARPASRWLTGADAASCERGRDAACGVDRQLVALTSCLTTANDPSMTMGPCTAGDAYNPFNQFSAQGIANGGPDGAVGSMSVHR